LEIHRRPGAGGALRLGDRVEFLVQEDLGGGPRAVEVRRLVYGRLTRRVVSPYSVL